MSNSLKPKFSYGSLSTEDSAFLHDQAESIRGLVRQTAQHIHSIGQSLIAVKERLGHGRFRSWVETEFDWSVSTASKFMNVARRFKDCDIANMDIAASALYVLASSSVPDSALEEVVQRTAAGEKITKDKADEIKKKHLPKDVKKKIDKRTKIGKRQLLLERQESGVIVEDPLAFSPSTLAIAVKAGEFWGLGPHLLFCGQISSPKFLDIAPADSPLVLIYPPTPGDCPTILNNNKATNIVYLAQQGLDVNFAVLRDWTVNSLELATQEGEAVVVSYLPDPGLIRCLDEMECIGYITDPDAERCKNALTFWSATGGTPQKLTNAQVRKWSKSQ